MTINQFHNGLRLLRSIDSWELGDPHWWPEFRDSPYLFFIRADDATAKQIWTAMIKRGLDADPATSIDEEEIA